VFSVLKEGERENKQVTLPWQTFCHIPLLSYEQKSGEMRIVEVNRNKWEG